MIIILNGSVGSGKSTVSEELVVLFEKSVILDGDYIGLDCTEVAALIMGNITSGRQS